MRRCSGAVPPAPAALWWCAWASAVPYRFGRRSSLVAVASRRAILTTPQFPSSQTRGWTPLLSCRGNAGQRALWGAVGMGERGNSSGCIRTVAPFPERFPSRSNADATKGVGCPGKTTDGFSSNRAWNGRSELVGSCAEQAAGRYGVLLSTQAPRQQRRRIAVGFGATVHTAQGGKQARASEVQPEGRIELGAGAASRRDQGVRARICGCNGEASFPPQRPCRVFSSRPAGGCAHGFIRGAASRDCRAQGRLPERSEQQPEHLTSRPRKARSDRTLRCSLLGLFRGSAWACCATNPGPISGPCAVMCTPSPGLPFI